ncbi:MAG: Heme NO binding [Rhodobacteraceae bacterium HLUCCA12]|nr:MAG: Heme NO binding [Rhodobacteraceae bacterium HLUCCA12]
MHGLIGKAVQSFLSDTYGAAFWDTIALRSGLTLHLGPHGFEAMEIYDRALVDAVMNAASRDLATTCDSLLEDLGTYLISNARMDPLRRLLRFGGVSFTDFLHSLDDLQGRTRLAVPELALPELTIDEAGAGRFILTCHCCSPGFGHVMVGILRALADDYGALVVLEHLGRQARPAAGARRTDAAQDECIAIDLHDPAYHAGRRFDLAVPESC